MGIITFNGVSSEDLGIKVWTFPNYEIPEKEIQMIHVPGRSGDIAIDLDSYKNVERSYQVSLYDKTKSFAELGVVLSGWLHSANGYAELSDSYEPDFFRMALYSEEATLNNFLNQAVTATVVFNCKPQRYLISGNSFSSLSSPLVNPYNTIARPVFKVVGNGTLTVNGKTATVTNNSGTTLYIDSEIQDVYYMSGTTAMNGNSRVTFSDSTFPVFTAGSNVVSSSGFSSVEVKPKWWTI